MIETVEKINLAAYDALLGAGLKFRDRDLTSREKSALDMTAPEFAAAMRDQERAEIRRRHTAADKRDAATLEAKYPAGA